MALPLLESLKLTSRESLPLKAHQTANVAHYNSCSVLPRAKTYCSMSLESFHLLLATHRAGRKPKPGQRLSRLHTLYFSPSLGISQAQLSPANSHARGG